MASHIFRLFQNIQGAKVTKLKVFGDPLGSENHHYEIWGGVEDLSIVEMLEPKRFKDKRYVQHKAIFRSPDFKADTIFSILISHEIDDLFKNCEYLGLQFKLSNISLGISQTTPNKVINFYGYLPEVYGVSRDEYIQMKKSDNSDYWEWIFNNPIYLNKISHIRRNYTSDVLTTNNKVPEDVFEAVATLKSKKEIEQAIRETSESKPETKKRRM